MAAFVDDDFDFTVLKLRPIFIFYIAIRSFFVILLLASYTRYFCGDLGTNIGN